MQSDFYAVPTSPRSIVACARELDLRTTVLALQKAGRWAEAAAILSRLDRELAERKETSHAILG